MTLLLVVNSGSSSVKVALFRGDMQVLEAQASEIGGQSRLRLGAQEQSLSLPDHRTALSALLEALTAAGHPPAQFGAAAHRVVHGGPDLTRACRVTPAVLAGIRACLPLAPLHNPANLAGIEALAALLPDLPHYASFDTAFHATMPPVATRYALPREVEARGYRRYGFHGLSYASIAERLPGVLGAMPGRVLAYHLGNGASACAMRDGRSVATSMGYSPLEGLTMGTRSGSIDPTVVLRLAELYGIAGTERMLNREAGLLGLGGRSDMRALLADPAPRARFAVQHFINSAVSHGGALMAAMGGLDAVVFTGGIGENASPVRGGILDGLAWAGVRYDAAANEGGETRLDPTGAAIPVLILPAEEEAHIAAEARALMKAGE
ncbi:acetate/propionate family kinase [Szabonella alba]|uniref:Acetate kinase n=1 Tax=Szabonella alba TaxID=2804194 RepID=A0A8K0VA59_9RHOB|nr:acetate/propionate family kinase [Szabonella alba]MBL4918158.1 acetate/propionate family kinase [Szabonella alba]